MIHQSAYILQPKQKKKKVEKKEKKEMKKEVKKEIKKEEKSSSSTKGPGGEHMFQVSTCIATDIFLVSPLLETLKDKEG